MGSISRDFTFNFSFASIHTRDDPITCRPINFTPDIEYEVIMEALSNKSDKPLFNISNTFWIDTTQNKTTTLPFHIGDYLRFNN